MPATKEEIDAFLKKFKKAWPPQCFVLPTDKNEAAIHVLGITERHRAGEINSLTSKYYYEGSEDDEDGSPGEIWTFLKMVKGFKVYIKLKIRKIKSKSFGNTTLAKCMSFHTDISVKLEGGDYV